MVDAISPITNSKATTPTQIDRSLSITSEPDNKWVAARQSIINSDQLALRQANADLQADIARYSGAADDEMEVSPDHRSHGGGSGGKGERPGAADQDEQQKLSGESDMIGTVDFDVDTPFGHRTAVVKSPIALHYAHLSKGGATPLKKIEHFWHPYLHCRYRAGSHLVAAQWGVPLALL